MSFLSFRLAFVKFLLYLHISGGLNAQSLQFKEYYFYESISSQRQEGQISDFLFPSATEGNTRQGSFFMFTSSNPRLDRMTTERSPHECFLKVIKTGYGALSSDNELDDRLQTDFLNHNKHRSHTRRLQQYTKGENQVKLHLPILNKANLNPSIAPLTDYFLPALNEAKYTSKYHRSLN